MKKNKKLWIAIVLNVLLPGTGYLYIGIRKQFGIFVFLGSMAVAVWYFQTNNQHQVVFDSIWFYVSTILFAVAFMLDTYKEGKRIKL